MTNEAIMKYIDNMIQDVKELNAVFAGNINRRLDEIIKQNEVRNGRLGKCEGRITAIELELSSENGEEQGTEKERARNAALRALTISKNRYLITTIIAVTAFVCTTAIAIVKIRQQDKVPIELIYDKTDSTYIFPNLYFRSNGDQGFKEIHEVYVDINKDEK